MGGGNTLFVTGLLTAGILVLGSTAASASAADERIVSFDAVYVRAPGGIEDVRCFAGPAGSKAPCDRGTAETERVATFGRRGLAPNEGLTIVVGLAEGAVTVPPPRLGAENNGSGTALGELTAGAGPLQAGLAVAIFLAGLAVAGIRYRSVGRDRSRYEIPLGIGPAIVAESSPPGNLPPALVGVLIDECADNLDLAATIVDLAIRGHLRIREQMIWHVRDWELAWIQPPPGAVVTPFERDLLTALFGGGPVVRLSQLRQDGIGAQFDAIKEGLHQESVRLGWFDGEPGVVHRQWTIAGVVVFGIGLFGTFWARSQRQDGVALLGVALAAAGTVLWLAARATSSRTVEGAALYERMLGFKRYLEQAEADQLRFASWPGKDGHSLFARYLPYAMVFGVAGGWTRAFHAYLASTGSTAVEPVWFAAAGVGSYEALGHSLARFGKDTWQALPTVVPDSSDRPLHSRSSGGSSGGGSSEGGGGGGGDSW